VKDTTAIQTVCRDMRFFAKRTWAG